MDTTTTAGTRAREQASAWLLGLLLATIGLAALPIVLTLPAPGHLLVPLPVIAIATILVERAGLHLTFDRQAHTFTLAEVVIGAGLLIASPLALLGGRLLGAALDLALVERQRPVKLLFNLGLYAVGTSVALILFHAITGPEPSVARCAAAAVIASLVVTALEAALVSLAIAVTDGPSQDGVLTRSHVFALGVGTANAAVGVLAAVTLTSEPLLAVLVAAPVVLLWLAYRSAISSEQRRDDSRYLYETAVLLQPSADADALLTSFLDRLRQRFNTEGAELLFLPVGDGAPRHVTTGPPSADLRSVGSQPTQLLAARLPGPGAAELNCRDGRCSPRRGDAMTTTLGLGDGSVVVLRVSRPRSDVRQFDRHDLDAFQTFAAQASLALENQALSTRIDEMSELDRMKQAFLSAVSHDLRTPLAVVLGGAETLHMHHDRLDAERLEGVLTSVESNAKRLDRILTDLLDVDRLSRGVLEPHRRRVDVTTLVAQAAAPALDGAHPLNIPTRPVIAEVDPALVERIVENLVKNAVKYTPAGTTIDISLEQDERAVHLVVADDGPGIPAADRHRVFDPFTRVDEGHPAPGTGIGLSLVQRFAELHGGRVWVEERFGGGAEFHVVLAPQPELIALPR